MSKKYIYLKSESFSATAGIPWTISLGNRAIECCSFEHCAVNDSVSVIFFKFVNVCLRFLLILAAVESIEVIIWLSKIASRVWKRDGNSNPSLSSSFTYLLDSERTAGPVSVAFWAKISSIKYPSGWTSSLTVHAAVFNKIISFAIKTLHGTHENVDLP